MDNDDENEESEGEEEAEENHDIEDQRIKDEAETWETEREGKIRTKGIKAT